MFDEDVNFTIMRAHLLNNRGAAVRDMIFNILMTILDIILLVIHSLELATAIALGAATFWTWLVPILWVACIMAWGGLAIMRAREIHQINKSLKDLEKEYI